LVWFIFMSVTAFIFPGQGSQSVGMGRDLAAAFAAAREVFGEVDETLKQRLSKLMFEGPAEELILTENAQPALMALSMAVVRVLQAEAGIEVRQAALVAGHSLGEYSALAASGAIDLGEVARLLRLRGQAMQSAVPPGIGAMAALIGVEMGQAAEICSEAELWRREGQPDTRQVVQAANDNGGGQVVISGHREAVERALEIAKSRGVKRAMLLPVSAPFHCALMAPAADAMAEALEGAAVRAPVVPLVANVTAAKVTDPQEIKRLLVAQVTGTVRWRESVLACAAMGVDRFVELGAGRVLSGLVKRIAPDAQTLSAGTPAEIDALVKAF
jgi:[acyl-carrier-protein] S-malonyltransferase